MQFGGVGVVGGGQHLGGERVVVGAAQCDSGVRQVGVDVEVPVAGVGGGAAGGGDPGAHQRDHQVAGQFPGGGLGRGHHLGDRDGPHAGPFTPADADPHRRGQPDPAVRGVVQRPGMRGGVDGAVLPGVVVVHQPEAAADHGVTHLADRQRAGYRARPAQPHQPVGAGELLDRGGALHPVDAVPQRQHLRVAQQVADAPAHHQPFAQRAAVGLHRLGRRGRRTHHRPAGQQVPRPLTGLRVRRVFLVDRELVADPPVGDQLTVAGHLDQRGHPATAGGVDPQAVVLVGDLHAIDRGPARLLAGFREPVAAPAERADAVGPPAHRVPVVLDQHRDLRPVGVGHLRTRTDRSLQAHRNDVGSVVRQRVPHHHRVRLGGHRTGQQRQGGGAGRAAQLPGVAPAGQQVQVDLVGFRSGDGVVVGAPGQLHPGLGQRGLRIAGTGEQRGEHREPLGAQHGVLGGPVSLLGVDVGDVLAGVDRVHVPGLRRGPHPALCNVGAHRGEELTRQRADEPGPGVARVPVPVDVGDPGVGRGVVGAHRQQHVAGQRHRLQLAEQLVGGLLGLGERGRGVHPPAGGVVRGHVMRQQAEPGRRDPLELAAELHATRVAAARHRPPLVVRPPRPPARRQAGVGGHAGELRVVAEHVELPGGGRVGAEHVALETDAVHEVPDRRLRAGQVGVGLVVGAPHDLDAPGGEQAQQFGAVLRVGVEVRLEVVNLGEHELVDRVAAGHLEMRGHQREAVVLLAPAGRVLGPDAGVGGLGVPPHRVVVEVADHVHGPAGFGDDELEGALVVDLAGAALPDRRAAHPHRDLDRAGAGRHLGLAAEPVAVDPDLLALGGVGVADPHHLQRRVGGADEKLRRLRGGHTHAANLRAGRPHRGDTSMNGYQVPMSPAPGPPERPARGFRGDHCCARLRATRGRRRRQSRA